MLLLTNLKNVFEWVHKVLKSLYFVWIQSFGKRSRVRDRNWHLLPENTECNFKYNVFLIWNVIHAHVRKTAKERKIRNRKLRKHIFPIINLAINSTSWFSLEQDIRYSNRGIIPYITSHIHRESVFKQEVQGEVCLFCLSTSNYKYNYSHVTLTA